MKRILIILSIMIIFANGCDKVENSSIIYNQSYENEMKRDLLCIVLSYPKHIKGIQKDDEYVYILTKSDKKIIYDDKKAKSTREKLSNPDLQDMMEQIYPLQEIDKLMEENYDPGRIREYNLLREVYGGTRKQIELNLIGSYMGQFNKENGAVKALNNVYLKLKEASKTDKNILSFVYPLSGTYNYRYIAGSNRLSPHSFGIAIDLARNSSDYWQWATRKQGQKRLEAYSKEVVKIFEDNNFIWGGKWAHFDILHFEYRPEIILKARYFSTSPVTSKPWYEGIMINDDVQRYINTIDNIIK